MKKKLLMGLVALGVSLGGSKLYAQANMINYNNGNYKKAEISAKNFYKYDETKNTEVKEFNGEEFEIPSFEEEMGELIKELSPSQIEKLNKQYDKIVELEIEAENLWDQLDSELNTILDEKGIEWNDTECENGECEISGYEDGEYEDLQDFNQLLESIKSEIEPETYEELKKLYEEVLELEAKEEYEKVDSAREEIEKILESLDLEDISKGMNETGEMNEPKLIAAFNIKDGKIIYSGSVDKKPSKETIKKYEMLWAKAKKIIPKSYMNRIGKFTISTDGKEGILAFVEPDKGIKVWRLDIDEKDAFDSKGKFVGKDLDYTLIHEFAHILTLNDSQMMKEVKENSKTYNTDEGTTKENSYLNKFYQKFWKDIYQEWEKVNREAEEKNDEELLQEFYEKYQNRFVTDYAVTNPGEDIAESFTAFVMQDKPKGNSIKDKKILFFYDYDEAVKLRKEIRNNL